MSVERDPAVGDRFNYSDHDIEYTVTRVDATHGDVYYSDPTLDPELGDRQTRISHWQDEATLI